MSSAVLSANGANDARRSSLPFLLLGPALIVNLIGFMWPLVLLAVISFRTGGQGGAIGNELGLANWIDVLSDPFYLRLLVSTVTLSLVTTACTLMCSFPVALFIHRSPRRWRNLLVVVCITPLLISAVVRTYGWIVILGDSGLVASTVRAVGIEPIPLIFNRTGLVIGMVEILMPYMILSLMAGFGRLDVSLEEAASSLGASRLTVLRLIVVPLTMPGILLGCFLVFVITVSSFITPKVLAGGRVPLLATEIYDQSILTLNWPLASVLSYIALIIFGLATVLYMRTLRHFD